MREPFRARLPFQRPKRIESPELRPTAANVERRLLQRTGEFHFPDQSPMTAPESGLDLLVTKLEIRLADPGLRTDDRMSEFDAEARHLTPEELAMKRLDADFERLELREQAARSGSLEAYEKRTAKLHRSTREAALPHLRNPLSLGSLPGFEHLLGFPVPPEIAAIYSMVADGGFGPAQGLFPLSQSVDTYCRLRSKMSWPEKLLPLLDCAKGMVCLQVQSRQVGIYADGRLKWIAPDFLTFLDQWLDGRLKLRSRKAPVRTEPTIHRSNSAAPRPGTVAAVARGLWQRIVQPAINAKR